jgi:nucleoside-diphosphate-sugar epimerase
MLSPKVLEMVHDAINRRPLIVEGANGSLGLSIRRVLDDLNIIPSHLLLTTYSAPPDHEWSRLACPTEHLSASSENFLQKKLRIISTFPDKRSVIFGSGYGRPKEFLQNPHDAVVANTQELLCYRDVSDIEFFAYLSSSEVYSGLSFDADEESPLPTSPQHPRSLYIESKRIGEAILYNAISPICRRSASYRVALALPPKLLRNDTRVFADLARSALEVGLVQLNGGENLIRQYQYGPNAAYKLLGSLVNGRHNLYNNAGSHVVTLGDLARTVARVCNVRCVIHQTLSDNSSPPSVRLTTRRIDQDSEYSHALEKTFEDYVREIINDQAC